VDLRRVERRPRDDASDPVLVERIRDEIRRDGPITFARFMDIALYDPELGYYRGAAGRPGREGDFLTAPETHPIFGWTIARFAAAVHRLLGSPAELMIREHGAGEGALAEPLVRALMSDVRGGAAMPPPQTVRYLVDEVEPRRIAAIRERFARLDLPAGSAVEVVPDDRGRIDGLAIANEVLDALPFHRVVQRREALREVFVGVDDAGAFVDVEGEPSTPELERRLADDGVRLLPEQRAEISLAVDHWARGVAAGLSDGVLLVIDYGHPAPELYDPRRRAAGTLATYQGHRVGEEPYRAIGRQDITAHVDLTTVERAAGGAGLKLLGKTTQASFLAALGIGDLLVAEQTRPGATLQTYLDARSAVVRMIDPAATGGFAVLAFGAGSLATAGVPGFAPPDGRAFGPLDADAPATVGPEPRTSRNPE
jgi:SAM-dependent MidA family methyltransferase